jgi:hypothetical protein
MKPTLNLAFASALVLAALVPTLSHAAYFVDQTKSWATDTNEQAAKRPAIHAAHRNGMHAYAMSPGSHAVSGAGDVNATGGGSPGYNDLLSHSNNY